MPPRKAVISAPPTVVVRKKAAKRAPRAVPTQTGLPPAAAPVAPQSASSLVALPTTPAPSVPQLEPQPSALPVLQPPAPALESPPASPAVATESLSKTQQEKQARRELLDVFRQRWPLAFPQDFRQLKPLALGIHRDLATHLPEQPLRRISAVIGLFQRLSGAGYSLAIVRGGPRYDLNSNPRGEVTPEEQALAKRVLAAFYARRKARQQAREKAAAAPAPSLPAPNAK